MSKGKPDRKVLKLNDLKLDRRFQVRVKDHLASVISEEKIKKLTKEIKQGDKEAERRIKVANIDGHLYVMDGFHRCAAFKNAGKETIKANVYKFDSVAEARRYTLKSANKGQTASPLREKDLMQMAWTAYRLDSKDGTQQLPMTKKQWAADNHVSTSTLDNFRWSLEAGCNHENWYIAKSEWQAAKRLQSREAGELEDDAEPAGTLKPDYQELVKSWMEKTTYAGLKPYQQRQAVDLAKHVKTAVDDLTNNMKVYDSEVLIGSLEYMVNVLLRGKRNIRANAFVFNTDDSELDPYLMQNTESEFDF